MANVRKKVIENKVYSEILFRLGVHKRYVNDFVNQFVPLFGVEKGTSEPKKEQSVLQRQMEFLRKEGFLLTTKLGEDGKKLTNNKKMYYIDFEKIIDEFLDYSKLLLDKKISKGYKSSTEVRKNLSNRAWRKKAKENKLIRYVFSAFMEEIRQHHHEESKITLKEMFDAIHSIAYIEDSIRRELDDRFKDSSSAKPKIKENLKKEYAFFIEFMHTVNSNIGLRSIIQRLMPIEISNILIEGFSKEDLKYYRVN